MDEQGLQNLLALGFTYEDLYKRGLLVLKPAEQKPDQQKQDQQKPDQQKQDQQKDQQKQDQQKPDQQKQDQQKDQQKQDQQKQEPEQKQDVAAALTAVLESFKDDLIKAIQRTNLRDATRDENEKKLSLDDAIAGLMKGDSSNG